MEEEQGEIIREIRVRRKYESMYMLDGVMEIFEHSSMNVPEALGFLDLCKDIIKRRAYAEEEDDDDEQEE